MVLFCMVGLANIHFTQSLLLLYNYTKTEIVLTDLLMGSIHLFIIEKHCSP